VSENVFAIVPIEVLADSRLTLEQMRVLVGLFSFRNKDTGLAWPSRAALSERCGGMHVSNISAATTALCKMGWIIKSGNIGNSRSSEYAIRIPESISRAESVADSATSSTEQYKEKLSTPVAEQTTLNGRAAPSRFGYQHVAESATSPLAESATSPLADSARSIEQTNELTKEQTIEQTTARDERAAGIELLAKKGVPEKLAGEWLDLRSKKRLPCIDAVILNAIWLEADKAGFTFEKTVQVCCNRGWGGFKQSWLAADLSDTEWCKTDAGIMKKGCEVKLIARPGESMEGFAVRIKERLSRSR